MNIIPFNEMAQMAQVLCQSGLFGIKKQEEALALMLIAQAEGRHPAIVARDYHIISGRPTLKADAMLARFQEAGGGVEWLILTDSEVRAKFTHKSSGTFELEWTIEQAQKAQLLNNPTWKKFPRAMLRSRVLSEGIRTSYPSVICGTYTPDEVENFVEVPHKNEAPSPKIEKAKPILELGSESFEKCKAALKNGFAMADLQKKYTISNEIQFQLLLDEEELTQTEENIS
jgi:hypothetical protein